jgi:hypothetical protein
MGIERLRSPRYWRKRAQQFRTKSENAEHRQLRESLLKVARNYDGLARRAERIRAVQDC